MAVVVDEQSRHAVDVAVARPRADHAVHEKDATTMRLFLTQFGLNSVEAWCVGVVRADVQTFEYLVAAAGINCTIRCLHAPTAHA